MGSQDRAEVLESIRQIAGLGCAKVYATKLLNDPNSTILEILAARELAEEYKKVVESEGNRVTQPEDRAHMYLKSGTEVRLPLRLR